MSLGGLLSIGRALERIPARPATFRDAKLPTPSFGLRNAAAPETAATTQPRSRWQESLLDPETTPSPRNTAAPTTRQSRRPHHPARTIKPAPAPQTHTQARLLVQGELALTAVRVVRNDLSADGLELIPRPGPAVSGMTLRPDRPRSVVTRGGWRGWLAHWRQWWRGARS